MRAGELYLQAALEVLRENRTLFPTSSSAQLGCKIMPGDECPANAGRIFVGLRIGVQRPINTTANRLFEEIGLIAAVTVRSSDLPNDSQGARRYSAVARQGARPTTYQLSIEEVINQVIGSIHNNYQLINYANYLIINNEPAPHEWPVMTPLFFSGQSPNGPQTVGANHFLASTPSEAQRGRPDMGLFSRVTFDGGQRYSPLYTVASTAP